ncbi:Por secretion system C-terminal sorting domain containing protein [Chryseobacterium populi]|uniref:Por secretion system C-terminal sorting domain containing protein n=2 Tax=Chryseobacterium populi TaxID=1144316 RepID=J2T260_9FLAO|nr:Por secretion system C-terminal sorting domain containing protein [Chryseobacterium populi]
MIFALISFINAFSQNTEKYYNSDRAMRKMDAKYAHLEKDRKEVEARLAGLDKRSYLNKVGATTSWNGLYTGQIYEIPVVVHVIESQAAANAYLSLTDQEIIDWIDRTNSMFATTFGNGFYPEGPGPDGGAVMPFKLVLAKRSPSCTPTTGIVRYNGSTIPSYDTWGVRVQGTVGVRSDKIRNAEPHWPETSYFNIYVVIGFDGQQQLSYEINGVSTYPGSYDYYYDSFIKVAVIKAPNNVTLTRQIGMALGLYYTFQGDSDNYLTGCPINNNCETDGDRVCDTSPSKSMEGSAVVPDNNTIDPCTGQNYDGTQYNVMNETSSSRKFTEGQRDRAVMMMMENRKNLLNSTAGQDPSVVIPSPVSVVAAQCNPAGTLHPTNNNFTIGPYKVNFGSINSTTNGYDSDEAAPVYYADYCMATCIRPAYYTDISATAGTPLRVSYLNGLPQADKFKTKVWIDYNNNGSFEDTELVVNDTSVSPLDPGSGTTLTNNITVPASAVKNTYLRMRVAVDAATFDGADLPDFGPCAQLQYGQMEDYAVRILDVLGTSEVKNNSETKIIYLKSENKLKLVGGKNSIFGNYEIYDASGKILQKGVSKSDEIQINQQLPKGMYMINYSDKKESKKFLNN